MADLPSAGPYAGLGKIGLICPSTNTSIEPEFHRMAPPDLSVHVARAFQDGPQALALYRQIAENVESAACDLGSAGVDVIAFGCTSCSYFFPGDVLTEAMTRMTGAPAVLTSDAVVAGLRALGARRIALATPRTDFVNRRETECFSGNVYACLQLTAHAGTNGDITTGYPKSPRATRRLPDP